MDAELSELLKKHGGNFRYCEDDQTFIIYGTNQDGNYYESDDLPADTLAEAEQAAVEYLTVYHEED